ncbi:hypothetical protein [Mycolicibacterium fortuitum]|uniref:Uncharacterized protein n=2 Tax=Mycolicibacterium fortuitum TaxID=1766 RepID=A0AAE4VK56_MYCFO|nr:hypothetical protein [Mycolicibacterium fortuitum]MCV7143091.1 hypothetical protein [Mycolicibacterium fortuitum]MDV7195890.1 hypothetical protein [Mycolicibacterium fortuitum]MDV7209561.1 hypothetical protein [Mycolicibacterium fortuitum]MDV7231392.1 hypothetical protein [Mycolicibacterium fortuitum]MDV7262910.1 hypothetical protein [Mycolicibacterium fortuitum]
MVKILDTCAAIERYEWRRDLVDHRPDKAIPEDFGVLHACHLPPNTASGLLAEVLDAKEPVFASHGRVAGTACGRFVSVLLPMSFDSEHPKACSRCLDAIGVKGG